MIAVKEMIVYNARRVFGLWTHGRYFTSKDGYDCGLINQDVAHGVEEISKTA